MLFSKCVTPKEAACTEVGGVVMLSFCVYADQMVQCNFGFTFWNKIALHIGREGFMAQIITYNVICLQNI